MTKYYWLVFIIALLLTTKVIANPHQLAILDHQIAKHKPLSGVMLLDKGEDALIARAWLADHAIHSIDVQYFIWSSDNIGILAAESLLRAAERGVKVRVIVDDFLIDTADNILLALAAHPNIHIRIYNPQHSVGTTLFERMVNAIKDFRAFNQRMHDKTFTVDSKVSITGGRNMADEYFDYNQSYNFRDRDVLIVGSVVTKVEQSFNRFWNHPLSQTVMQRFANDRQLLAMGQYDNANVQELYAELHQYAQSADNFEPVIRQIINDLDRFVSSLINEIVWTKIDFISDIPGKNNQPKSFSSGSHTAFLLAEHIRKAKKSIIIQSPYLILSKQVKKLFLEAIERGVKIIISTNSLVSTDNLQAFSGYKNQKSELMDMGIHIFEYKAFPDAQKALMTRYSILKNNQPIFAIHAKSMVIDSKVSFIGTYNLDPRSQNLNTEVVVVIEDELFADTLKNLILVDVQAKNSWSAEDNADQYASWFKRATVLFWQILPIEPLL